MESKTRLPLSHVRVLDTTKVLAGPYATMILADLGAEIIKVERPPQGDLARVVNLPMLGKESGAYFQGINRGKKSVVLNMKTPEAREIFYKLVAKCDVVIDNNQYGVNERLGIDYKTLCRYNPNVIACSISGFGHTGPERHKVGLDLTTQARSGGMYLTGTGKGDHPPLRMGFPMGDLAAGIWAAMGMLAALNEKAVTGRGTHIDISLLDSSVALLSYMAANYFASGVNPTPVGSGHHSAVPYQAIATQDGWIVLAVYASLEFWQRFCKATSLEHLLEDHRFDENHGRVEHKDYLIPIIERRFREKTTDEWLEAFKGYDVPIERVAKMSDVFSDPQVLARNMIGHTQHPLYGEVRMVGTPIKMSHVPDTGLFAPAPVLGQHTREVLKRLLEYSDEKINELVAKGAAESWDGKNA